MALLMVSGTGTEVGKTVTTAAVAALALAAGRRVAVVKPVQTGLPPGGDGDLADVVRLAGPVTTRELARYPDPLAPATAARRAVLPPVRLERAAAELTALQETHDLVLCEGAGGLLARFDERGWTLADLAVMLGAPVLVVAAPGLGTLNATALTTEVLRHRDARCAGVVVGSWPVTPDLAMRCNLGDLPTVAGAPLEGILPAGMAGRPPAAFAEAALAGLAPSLGGVLDVADFTARHTA